jgi:hypothetical protein
MCGDVSRSAPAFGSLTSATCRKDCGVLAKSDRHSLSAIHAHTGLSQIQVSCLLDFHLHLSIRLLWCLPLKQGAKPFGLEVLVHFDQTRLGCPLALSLEQQSRAMTFGLKDQEMPAWAKALGHLLDRPSGIWHLVKHVDGQRQIHAGIQPLKPRIITRTAPNLATLRQSPLPEFFLQAIPDKSLELYTNEVPTRPNGLRNGNRIKACARAYLQYVHSRPDQW